MAERTVNSRQLEVLKWIVDGCPDGGMNDRTYKTSAVSLQGRRLVTISRRRGIWKAEPTAAGRFLVENGRYPSGHWDTGREPAPFPLASTAPRPSPVIERKVTGLRPADQMIADLVQADGVLTVATGQGGYWEGLAASATRYNKVPTGKVLKIQRGETWSETVIRLVDAPAWMTTELAPITVSDQLRSPHAVIKNLRDNRDRLRLKRDTRARALRILDAIAKSAESRGYQVSAPPVEHGYLHPRGYLHITISGHPHTIDMAELNDKVLHEPTVQELKDKERHPWVRIPTHDHVPSGRLALKLVGGWQVRQETFADTKTINLEDRLPTVLQELELRSAAEEERDRKLELERQERRRHWEQVFRDAKSSAREQHRADTLMNQAERWQQAKDLAAYLDAATSRVETLHGEKRAAAEEWLGWGRRHLRDIDPLNHTLAMPSEPTPTPEVLKPFMHGLSPYGPGPS